MLQITTQRTTTPKAKPDESSLGFGVHYTDHMLIIDHDEEQAGTMPHRTVSAA